LIVRLDEKRTLFYWRAVITDEAGGDNGLRRDLAMPLLKCRCRHARDEPLTRHARLYAGHPRLSSIATPKTWMAGTSPAMTKEGSMSGHDELKGTAFSRHARA
jgi:hypothetical protein